MDIIIGTTMGVLMDPPIWVIASALAYLPWWRPWLAIVLVIPIALALEVLVNTGFGSWGLIGRVIAMEILVGIFIGLRRGIAAWRLRQKNGENPWKWPR